MSNTYTTVAGDCWDLIAYKVYGDELKADWLMKNNLPLLDTFVFNSGVAVNTPELPTTETTTQTATPAWRE